MRRTRATHDELPTFEPADPSVRAGVDLLDSASLADILDARPLFPGLRTLDPADAQPASGAG